MKFRNIFLIFALFIFSPQHLLAEDLSKYIKASLPKHWAFSLLVPNDTSNEQLKSIISVIQDARLKNTLGTLGFEPTTPKGKKGPYAIIDIWIFRDPKWATEKKLSEAYEAEGGSKYEKQFNEKVAAHYLYTVMGIEDGSIGYKGSKNFEQLFFNKF